MYVKDKKKIIMEYLYLYPIATKKADIPHIKNKIYVNSPKGLTQSKK